MSNSPAQKETIISLKNVAVHYSRKRGMFRREPFVALKDVSFDIYQGDSLGVIGRNGAGKSTLLRLLGGIIKPEYGTVINDGHKTALLSLQIGFDPQLSGRYNAIVSGMLLGFRKKEVEEKLDEIIAFSELESAIDNPIYTYSSGMRARLGFSVAIHLDPDVLLIDEVLAVGDMDFRKKSQKIMHEKLRSDKTLVLVSHSTIDIKNLCTRAVWIEEGVTRLEGDTKTVIEAYEDFMKQHAKK